MEENVKHKIFFKKKNYRLLNPTIIIAHIIASYNNFNKRDKLIKIEVNDTQFER